jgi:hypothetical protein
MAYRLAQGHQMMSLGMALLWGDITQSSTYGELLAEADSETDNSQSKRKLARLSTRENRTTAH